MVSDYEARLVYERDQHIEEITTLKAKVTASNDSEQRRIKEILA